MRIMVVGEKRKQKTVDLFRVNRNYVLFRFPEFFLNSESREHGKDGGKFDILIAYPRTEFLDTSVKESMGMTQNGNLSAWGRLSNYCTLKESAVLEKRLNDLSFFSYLWDTDIPKICIVADRIPEWGDKKWDIEPKQKVGSTYLWLKGLPELKMSGVGDIEQAMREQWMGGGRW